jgi:hypothetical protein
MFIEVKEILMSIIGAIVVNTWPAFITKPRNHGKMMTQAQKTTDVWLFGTYNLDGSCGVYGSGMAGL